MNTTEPATHAAAGDPSRAVSHRALEWLQRRADGESVAAIAARAGVSIEAIRRATNPYGPFPRTSKESRTTTLRPTWIQLRRDGIPTQEIAARYGVSPQTVSSATVADGPYPRPGTPTPAQTTAWVAARRAGTSIAAIAAAHNVTPGRVADATRPHGPYPHPPKPPLPDGLLCLADLGRRLGVAVPTVTTWLQRGYLPPPDFTTKSGRKLWLTTTITASLPHSGLQQCPTCGGWARQLPRHQAHHHQTYIVEAPAVPL